MSLHKIYKYTTIYNTSVLKIIVFDNTREKENGGVDLKLYVCNLNQHTHVASKRAAFVIVLN